MKMFKIILAITWMAVGVCNAAIYQNYFTTNANPVVGGGGIVSNTATPLAFDLNYDATHGIYTNATDYYALVRAQVGMSGTNQVDVFTTNSDFTRFEYAPHYFNAQLAAAGTVTNTFTFLVPPRGFYAVKTNGLFGATATGRQQVISYIATNGSSSGSGTTYTNNNTGQPGWITGSGISTNFSSGITANAAQIGAMANTNALKIAAFYVTNNVENRESIYVSGNTSSLVNGQYKVKWYNPDAFLGIWTNTASTNMILMNNPSNTSIADPFVIAGSATPSEYMYQDNYSMYGVRDSWINPFLSDGMTTFSGTATLTWATNKIRRIVVVPYDIGYTNNLVATNMIVVDSGRGDDSKATRLNGISFQSLYVAQSNAHPGDLVFLKNGYYVTDPFHMTNRGVHILGEGDKTVVVEIVNHDDVERHFQSRVMVPWDNCSIGNLTITNGAIAFAQFSGFSGGTNIWVHDLNIYPPTQIKFPDNTQLDPSDGDQQTYYNVGVQVSRIGDDNRIERVRVYSSLAGFSFKTTYGNGRVINLVDCEAYCTPERAGPSIWTNNAFLGSATNVGGMIPLGFAADSPVFAAYTTTINIQGGSFLSYNGGTNKASYVGGETQVSRNASLWISRAYTNTLTINISGVPRFSNGNTNTLSYAILNETTNNNVVLAGWYFSNRVEQVTNVNYTGTPTSAQVFSNAPTIRDATLLGTTTAQNIAQPTNTWAINTAFGLGTNSYYTGGAQTLGVTGVANSPASDIYWGELEIVPTGDIIFTNAVSIRTSDYLDTRTFTNGGSWIVAVRVKPGVSTNLSFVQFR